MMTFERRPRLALRRRSRPTHPRSCAVSLRDVTVTDDDGRLRLDGADLHLAPGSTSCVVGSSAGDEAALAGVILGLHRPERGVVTIDGDDPAALPLDEIRSIVAVVLRDPWLVDGSIADNISFGHPGTTRSDIETAAATTGLDRFVADLPGGYDAPALGLAPVERRRIALARALVRDPGVLILEEPTADLDAEDERRMTETVEGAAEGRTTILLTHRPGLAGRADTVLVIEDGRIVPYRGRSGGADHVGLWATRIPPVAQRSAGLRLVGPDDRRPVRPVSTSWGIRIGAEMVPGHLASSLLGRDADTETWVAWSVERDEPVRIKVPRCDPPRPAPGEDPVTYRAWEQLSREHRLLRRLSHPGLVTAHEADLEAEMPYAVLEYLDSTSLARSLHHRGRGMEPLDVLDTAYELACTLDHLHRRGLVHLDLRPDHVRTRDGAIVLSDLAHCRPIGTRRPEGVGRRVPADPWPGTISRPRPPLVAPELRAGRPADPAMDVYALGALIHRATAGPDVHAGLTGSGAPVPYHQLAPHAPAAMAEAVDRMLSLDPTERPTAAEVRSRLWRIAPRTRTRVGVSAPSEAPPRLRLVAAGG